MVAPLLEDITVLTSSCRSALQSALEAFPASAALRAGVIQLQKNIHEAAFLQEVRSLPLCSSPSLLRSLLLSAPTLPGLCELMQQLQLPKNEFTACLDAFIARLRNHRWDSASEINDLEALYRLYHACPTVGEEVLCTVLRNNNFFGSMSNVTPVLMILLRHAKFTLSRAVTGVLRRAVCQVVFCCFVDHICTILFLNSFSHAISG
jgi:hypothetical protein